MSLDQIRWELVGNSGKVLSAAIEQSSKTIAHQNHGVVEILKGFEALTESVKTIQRHTFRFAANQNVK